MAWIMFRPMDQKWPNDWSDHLIIEHKKSAIQMIPIQILTVQQVKQQKNIIYLTWSVMILWIFVIDERGIVAPPQLGLDLRRDGNCSLPGMVICRSNRAKSNTNFKGLFDFMWNKAHLLTNTFCEGSYEIQGLFTR